jgi:hypothetical protein
VVTGLEQGRTYYFAATAVNTASVESDFSNEVSAALSTSNQPPVANAGPDRIVNEGATVTLSGANSMDPEGGALTFSWRQVSGTNVTLINPSAAQTTFTPPNVGPDGVALGFELTVTDSGGLHSADTCLVNVSWLNQPPTANAGTDQKVSEGAMVTLNGAVSNDPDGFALSYAWTQVSGGSSVILNSSSVAQPTFVAPSVGEAGESLMFQLTVKDLGGLEARDSCIVNVVYVNQPPVANAGSDQSVNQGVSVTLNGTGSKEPDGSHLAYYWSQKEGPSVTIDNPVSAQPSFIAPTAASTLVFSLTVTDPQNLSSSDECSVVVNGSPSVETNKTVSGIDLSGRWLSLTRTVKRSVSTFRGKIRVTNLGNLAAPSSVLHVYQSTDSVLGGDPSLGQVTVSSIPAGGYVDVNVRFYAPYNRTTVHLLGILDADNAIVETNESNNMAVSGQR